MATALAASGERLAAKRQDGAEDRVSIVQRLPGGDGIDLACQAVIGKAAIGHQVPEGAAQGRGQRSVADEVQRQRLPKAGMTATPAVARSACAAPKAA
ncbi:hypothetical protein [Plastoroseomonas arctica]|uniref:Uncharacterized protein n=1 Tax=Plastoroseomonas arctica TaxID=1509237 RepID=A0AAF1KQ75_9PROT|nr:hypothetical protein [Plastoroseomonas arctica]MBR0657163.1 hypothetical protein [Plastoroseomonas arctica]